ncbi:TonB-dependent receptor [Filimonas effusa]|uniref:TonB-dependent receptor n=2 Tax=Filimonas effusa TaxID=2508721 RepID=A0A4Q1D039_9BACT|nr:TonB-dependent receptor [Filimonas effusa]
MLVAILCPAFSQQSNKISGKVYDAISKEPVQGAVISAPGVRAMSDARGEFHLLAQGKQITIASVGFDTAFADANGEKLAIALRPHDRLLQQVVVSANRTAEKRSEAPVAIAVISKETIDDTKAQRMDQLLNKVSGVNMIALSNEQHQMSIRQPITTKSLFLYMEDGLPIRTTGVYNHNALLEMNMAAAKTIEVIKGPASALYGAEAIAGAVNVITQAAPAFTSGSISTQIDNLGYKRADAQLGTSLGKWGVIASGYYANRSNGPVDFSDFHKSIATLRTDYKPNDKMNWTNTLAYLDYNADMTGSLDSLKFARKNYTSQQTFTFRSVYALRYKSMLNYQWNKQSSSSLSFLFRDNSIKQNPSYSISAMPNTTDKSKYRGQINENAFQTYALFAQHTQRFNWLNSKVIAGATLDLSPQRYNARFITIHRDINSGIYDSYANSDSLLSNYKTGITNMAGYLDYEFSPVKNVRIVTALRYDAFRYDYTNKLPANKVTGAASTVNNFSRFTPKLGLTYNYRGIGFYGNYSQGYVPPQLTELYSSTAVAPYLLPQTFFNYEVGGWLSLVSNKLYADWSIYLMNGSNEIISVLQPDNTTINQNAGNTRHKGIEYGLTYKTAAGLTVRFSGSGSKHAFIRNVAGGINYNGYEMSGAPRFTGNAEVTYKPTWINGLRVSAEWQHVSGYYMDDLNKTRYKGYDVLNLRTGYQWHGLEIWTNVLNLFNQYYATTATAAFRASGTTYSYNLADPRNITIGLGYRW